MNNNLIKAKNSLQKGNYTCVLCFCDQLYFSTERGIKPLVNWLNSGIDFSGFSGADKVVGKGAAFLYALMKVKNLYASVISKPALLVLNDYGIKVEYDTLVDYIVNRKGDGVCPFEEAVKDVSDAQKAYDIICNKLQSFK